MNLDGIEDLRSRYRRMKDHRFPPPDVRSFVHDAISWTLDAPDIALRQDKLAEIIVAVPPRAYTGSDGLLVQVKNGSLVAYRGQKEIPLYSLQCSNFNGDYDPEYHPSGKAPAYAWIDTGDLEFNTAHLLLMNIAHIVAPRLSVRTPRRQGTSYAQRILFNAGSDGHAYFGGLSVTAPPDMSQLGNPSFDPRHDWYPKNLGDVLMHAGRSGLFVARDVVVEEVAQALYGVSSHNGRGSIHNLKISQHTSGPYSISMAAEQGGRLHLSGKIESAEKILQHAGDGLGMVTVFAPTSNLFLYVPERLTAVADQIFVNLGTNHRKKVELIARYIQREVHRGYSVEIEDRILDWTEDGQEIYDHISVAYDPPELEFPQTLYTVSADELSGLDQALRFEDTVASLKQKATLLQGSP